MAVENLLQVNYLLHREPCATDQGRRCQQIKEELPCRAHYLWMPRTKAKSWFGLPAFFNNRLLAASWEEVGVRVLRIPPAAQAHLKRSSSICKSAALTYVAGVKQMSQESRFSVWRGISRSQFASLQDRGQATIESRRTSLVEFTQNCGKVMARSAQQRGTQTAYPTLFWTGFCLREMPSFLSGGIYLH